MNKLAAVLVFGGFLLVFGAVGGMDNPDQAEYFFHQMAAALTGVFFMFIGAVIMDTEVSDE
jgi:hypothetical protein